MKLYLKKYNLIKMSKLIDKFCIDLDTSYLDQLPLEYQNKFKEESIRALKTKGTRKDIARIVINHFNNRPIPNRKKAENHLKQMSVALTGAISGSIFVGTHLGTKGAVLQVHSDILPCRRILNRIRPFSDLWNRFLIKLGSVEPFTDMSIKDREKWLSKNQSTSDFFDEKDRLQLLQPGVGDFDKKKGSIFVSFLPGPILNNILGPNPSSSDGYWSPEEIDRTVIQYTGKTSTLVVMKVFWKISTSYHITNSFDNLVIDIENPSVFKKKKAKEKEKIVVIGSIAKSFKKDKKRWVSSSSQDIGFLVPRKQFNIKLASKLIPSVLKLSDNSERLFQRSTKGFTASAFKSLLQKIIRLMPEKIEMIKNQYLPAEEVLLLCLSCLMANPGSFVPNIQRFVSGLESCTKRLAVTILEDSSLPQEESKYLFQLLASALLSQRVKEWKPTKSLIKRWYNTALIAFRSRNSFGIRYKEEINKHPYFLSVNNTIKQNSSAILDELKSFQCDLALARGWANNNYKETKALWRPSIMKLAHCVDQHWATQLVYFFPYKSVIELGESEKLSVPFSPLFRSIWNKSSSINPREGHSEDFNKDPFFLVIRKAQKQFLIALQSKQKRRKPLSSVTKLNYELHPSWIAGLVGVLSVRLKGVNTIVTLKTDDPLQLIAIRAPRSRRGKAEYKPLTPEQEEQAIGIARDRLLKGVSFNQATPPHESLNGCRVYLKSDEEGEYYELRKNNWCKRWDEARFLSFDLEEYEPMEFKVKRALTRIGSGVEKNYKNKLLKLFSSTPIKILRRAIIYLSTANSTIQMPTVGRGGDGGAIEDIGAFHFLLNISIIAPGAIRPVEGRPTMFIVPNGPLLWNIRKMLIDIVHKKGGEEKSGWNNSKFKDNRELFSYQKETLKDMINHFKDGLKGQFIWLPVGMGKTKIVLSYLAYMKKLNQLPTYIIYTLPPEAINSIIEELKLFGIKTNVMIPLKNISVKRRPYDKANVSVTAGCKPKEFYINLIIHDHLKYCPQDLLKYAGDSIIIFDEVHLFLNQSLRTSMGMNLSHLAQQFISFTGTPIVDNKTEKLIGWLEQIVPFEVNKRNFWVAANNMIAKKVTTGIPTNWEDIVAPFNLQEQKQYQKLVPPGLGGVNTNAVARDWIKASNICYKACDRKIVDIAKEMLSVGRRVMIVARNVNHQNKLNTMFINEEKISSQDIFLMGKDNSIFLTDESVKSGKTPDYKIVIVTKRKSQGYTLTRLNCMITSVYPSNNATREQLAGRINRIGQKVKPLLYRTVHIGLLTTIMNNHQNAKSLSAALQAISETDAN
jgi:superfamily II DNA or RNA helicase